MKKLSYLAALLMFFFLPQLTSAEIYSWIDENGVKHFSNEPPPEGVKILNQTKEIKTDKEKDRQREESDKQYMQKLEQESQASDKAPQKTENTAPESGQSDTVIIQESADGGDYDTFHRNRLERRVKKKHIREKKKDEVRKEPKENREQSQQ
jgi:hypothetical protein